MSSVYGCQLSESRLEDLQDNYSKIYKYLDIVGRGYNPALNRTYKPSHKSASRDSNGAAIRELMT